ncbi:hypothetical protein [Aeromonas veronii]|uniref:hypothetical protein n=1 Tax=Aeromonas veronii TaxID=654 RepID=UPI0011177DA8|nr:hypothetical protein [Aeromonas veronii]TNJ15166.1 hypothetical protein CF113_13205 [Aeromonas veronii]
MTYDEQQLHAELKETLQAYGLRATKPQLRLIEILIDNPIISRRDIFELIPNILHSNLTAMLDRFEKNGLVMKHWKQGLPYFTAVFKHNNKQQ